ncbi:MAG: hypothetical protein ACE368_03795 [Paracoccaceae bacterium]
MAAQGTSDRRCGARAGAGRAWWQVSGWSDRLAGLERLRQTLGYTETLKRGYAVVRADDRVVTRKAAAEGAGVLEIEFADGRLTVGAGGAPRKKAGGGGTPPPEQGSLF